MDVTKYPVPMPIAKSIMEDATGLDLAQHFADAERERRLWQQMSDPHGPLVSDEDAAWLDERRRQRARWKRQREEEERQARANALTVAALIDLLRELPPDAPVSITEHWYDDSEVVWADESIVRPQDDGSVRVGD